MLFIAGGHFGGFGRANRRRFPTANLIQQIAGAEQLAGDANLAEDTAGETLLITAVIDGKPLGIVELAGVTAENADAVGVKRADLRTFLGLAEKS